MVVADLLSAHVAMLLLMCARVKNSDLPRGLLCSDIRLLERLVLRTAFCMPQQPLPASRKTQLWVEMQLHISLPCHETPPMGEQILWSSEVAAR